MKSFKTIVPPVLGWLQVELDDEDMSYLWKLIENKKGNTKHKLAGQIDSSWNLHDEDDWFSNNVIKFCIRQFPIHFQEIGEKIPTSHIHPYHIDHMWVNYQKENEFNPLNHHNGIYSFVIWMKIPTNFEDQKKLKIAFESNSNSISNFSFTYNDILGNSKTHYYPMSKEVEGTMLFFPSQLCHQVYPFYNCDDDRISISGNISLKTNEIIGSRDIVNKT